jgi:hypothetical protein
MKLATNTPNGRKTKNVSDTKKESKGIENSKLV